jgi:hypothetical protein
VRQAIYGLRLAHHADLAEAIGEYLRESAGRLVFLSICVLKIPATRPPMEMESRPSARSGSVGERLAARACYEGDRPLCA